MSLQEDADGEDQEGEDEGQGEDQEGEEGEGDAGAGVEGQEGEDLEAGGCTSAAGGSTSQRHMFRKSHVVAPPIAPTREEDKIEIRPCGDG